MLHCHRPLPQPVSAHDFSDSNVKRTETKPNKVNVTKSAEPISQQDSAIESLTSESDFHQWFLEAAAKPS